MTDIGGENRLADTHSPYLLQHADNPVHWQPWDEIAREEAIERDVPIFLSIGYAACHWCHVMEDESFSDPSIATILNEHFVPIKVDREERPAIDRLYQTVSQLVTGSGGWPLSVWLTPDGRPFYIGTYFPPQAVRGRPSFPDICQQLAQSWNDDREAIEERADEWIKAARSQLTPAMESTTGNDRSTDRIGPAASAAARSADRTHGGFGESGPKFPQARRIELLLTASVLTNRSVYDEIVRETLDAMADRGIYDHIGGGFHRYATDRAWQIPHFEKMLYDNAELARLYIYAFQRTGIDRYAHTVTDTLDFVLNELSHPNGGAYSSFDAQSDGQEGSYYVWTPVQIQNALPDGDVAELVCERFGITKKGNFDGGTTVLSKKRSIDELATSYGDETYEVAASLEEAISTLYAVRSERESPQRDEKILASWNGLFVSALAEAGLIIDQSYAQEAERTLSFIRTHHWDDSEKRLYRRYLDGTVGVSGYLDDYAFLSRGALDLYQATGSKDALSFALTLARAMRDRFWEEEAQILAYTPIEENLIGGRQQDLTDQSIPSSTGVAVDVFSSLEAFAPDEGFETIIDTTIESVNAQMRASPTQHATLTLAANRAETNGIELTAVGDTLSQSWQDVIAETYLPGRLLTRRPLGEDAITDWCRSLNIDEFPPIWQGRDGDQQHNSLYICHDMTCSPPIVTREEADTWLDNFGFRS